MKDPVCGMQVDENKAPATSTHQGQRYVFCGQECKNKFDENPSRYAQQSGQQQGKGQSSRQPVEQHTMK